MRQKYCNIPVIIITTVDKRSQIIEAMQKGAKGYIVKLFNVSTLYSYIKSILGIWALYARS